MESVFVVCDVFFVSKLGADAVATVGLTESLLAIVYTIAMGLSIGVTATVARRTGEHDAEGASRTAVQGIALGIAVLARARDRRSDLRAVVARAHGRVAGRSRHRQRVHARDARRQRVDPVAVPDQRHLPRRGRCAAVDAHAVARERDQHRARTVSDLRARAVSQAWRYRRRDRDHDRAQHGRAVRARRSSSGRAAAFTSIAGIWRWTPGSWSGC